MPKNTARPAKQIVNIHMMMRGAFGFFLGGSDGAVLDGSGIFGGVGGVGVVWICSMVS